jgi:hypothetical protein
MTKPEHNPGIENEPHLQVPGFTGDPTEEKAARLLGIEQSQATDTDRVEHTVWSEPALSPQLVGQPGEDQLTYERWLEKSIRETDWAKSCWVTLLIALAAGPWGILGAIFSAGASPFVVVMVSVFGPVTEEVIKVAVALWVVEKRPYLFLSSGQILLCAACGGFAFAAIENLVYINIYFPKHTPEFVAFRWTACVALHVSCSLLAGVGLVRIWNDAIDNRHPPRLTLGVRWFVTAMVVHGLYNLLATFAESAGWLDFGMSDLPS